VVEGAVAKLPPLTLLAFNVAPLLVQDSNRRELIV